MRKKVFIGLLTILACSFSLSAQDLKFGYVNVGEILQIMPERIEAQKKIDTETTKLEDELNKMREELNKKFTAFQDEQETLSETIKVMKMKEINELDQRIQTFYEDARQDLQRLQLQEMQPIEEKIKNAIKAVGDREGYVSIIDSNSAYYFSPTKMTDVSPAVRAELGIK
ncbi:MAG: OmpH family outer membrane protein [Candidatus Azobacteroides sp.]|nr:OmpH family outer membrane protein [Candidatus Azobacteroides sp.]